MNAKLLTLLAGITSVCTLLAATSFAEEIKPRVINGTPVPASAYPTVGEVLICSGRCTDNGSNVTELCTGTLVAPRFILTAAHCVYNAKSKARIGDQDIAVVFSQKIGYRSVKIYANPTYSPGAVCVEGEHDAALVKLDTAQSAKPETLLGTAPNIGDQLVIVGYGQTKLGDNSTLPGLKSEVVQGDITVDSVSNTFVEWNFDPSTSISAPGDSGGPAFFEPHGGARSIAAVTSCLFTNDSQLVAARDTRADVLIPWVNAILHFTPAVNVSSAELQYLSASSKNNIFKIHGTVAIRPGYTPAGQTVQVRIGSYKANLTLGVSGRSSAKAPDSIALSGKLKRGAYIPASLGFSISLRSAAAFKALAHIGITTAADTSADTQITVPIKLTVDGATAATDIPLEYSADTQQWQTF